MIRAGTGLSTERATGRAGREAARAALGRAGVERAEVVLLFATSGHISRMEELAGEVRRASGARHIVGCSGYGVLTEEGEVEEGPGVALLAVEAPGVRLLPYLVEGLRGEPRRAGREVGRLAREAGERPLVVMLPDTYNLNAPELLSALAGEAGPVPVVGGGASEEGSLRRTFQFLDGRLATDAVAGLVMAGAFDYRLGVTQAYLPVGEPQMVTRAEGNFLHELGGRPAFEAFAEAAGPELMADLRRAAAMVFVGVPAEPEETTLARGNYTVRGVLGVDPGRGVLALPEALPLGTTVTFVRRDPARAREDLEAMVREVGGPSPGFLPRFGLYFNCCGRGRSLYGRAGTDVGVIRETLGGLPLAGFFTGAELAPAGGVNVLHQYTGVLLLIGETPGGGEEGR